MKLTRKIMSIILTVMLVLSCIPMSAISASALADLGVTIDTGAWVTLKDTNGDGYYEIGTADELYAFAATVNGGNRTINAILTANIVVNGNLLNDSGSLNSGDYRIWTSIGNETKPYAGHFKGNNKTIKGLYCDSGSYIGLFGYSTGTVENLGVVDSYIDGDNYAGTVVGYNEGTVKNCYKTGTFYGTAYVGGIVGYNTGTVENCYNSGRAYSGAGVYSGAVVGYNSGTTKNCYYADGYLTNSNSYAEKKTIEQFKSGEVAYLLGDAYGQTIGTDELPVLGGAKVYQVKNCKGDTVYSNNTNEVVHDSFTENGFCRSCGNIYQPATLNSNGYYEIDNAGKLYWFAQQVNSGNTAINAILTADIVVNEGVMTAESTDARAWTPIGNYDNNYTGTFDGNGKTVSGLYFNNDGDTKYVGLFGYIGKNSTVKNTGVINSYFSGEYYVGGVVGRNYGTITNCYNTGFVSGVYEVGGVVGYIVNGTIENCYNTGEVSGTNYSVGGVVGFSVRCTIVNCYNTGTVKGNEVAGGVIGLNDSGTITNCYNTGDVSGISDIGGVVGYIYTGTVENCYNTGEVSGTDYIGGVVGINYDSTIANCYYLDTTCNGGIWGRDVVGSAEAKTAEQFTSGEVAYLLGEAFGQTIGTDELPVLGGAKVYRVENCKGDVVKYSNTYEIIGHKFDNGICTVCGVYESAIDSNNDGYFEIDNAGKLYWFAQQVNSGNTSINAILTADIVVNEGEITENSTDARVWTPIGNVNNYYKGIFDGNNKTISGLYFNNTDTKHVGLFGYTSVNSEIKNLNITNSYIKGYWFVGSVVGYNSGTVTNCYNTGTVSGKDYVGGVVGSNYGTVANCNNTGTVSGQNLVGGVIGDNSWSTVTNCYNTGTVSGNADVGGVVGDNSGEIENCYNTGEVCGNYEVGGVVGSNYATVTNCYNTGTVSGNWDAGGVAGRNYNGTVTNCYNTGTISGNSAVGGVVSSNYATVTNCYYLDTAYAGGINGSDVVGSAEAKTAQQFAGGEVAYLLGEAFGQTIGTDKLPVLGGAKVYCGYTDCALSKKAYSNSPIETPAHNHILGDIDLDGIVSIRDVSTLSKYLASCTTLTDCQLSTADANGDGEININDATYIQKMLAELV